MHTFTKDNMYCVKKIFKKKKRSLKEGAKLVSEHFYFFGYTWVRIPPAPKKIYKWIYNYI